MVTEVSVTNGASAVTALRALKGCVSCQRVPKLGESPFLQMFVAVKMIPQIHRTDIFLV